MTIELDTRGARTDKGWSDADGFVGPAQPGIGQRSNPLGEFPTGPEVGTQFPNIRCLDVGGRELDFHVHRDGRPAIFVVYRSAVW